MAEGVADPLLLGQRIIAILETGLRTSTYKLATLMALIEHCIENMPEGADGELTVPIPELAGRVLEIYWRQVLPFAGGNELRQSTQPRARILLATNTLRDAADIGTGGLSIDTAALRAPKAYRRPIDEITLCLAQQPLNRLQRLARAPNSDCFLYDDSFLHDQVSRSALRSHGDAIVLKPGVAQGLARLARTWPTAAQSTTYCPGRWWVSTAWPTWYWPVPVATGTRVGRCRRSQLSTACWSGTAKCWSKSPRPFSGHFSGSA